MNEILCIANELAQQHQPLCDRCFGRVFGKLGHPLDNPTRGKAVRLVLQLKKALEIQREDDTRSEDEYKELEKMIERFSFDVPSMIALCKILGREYILPEDGAIDDEVMNETTNLVEQIKAILKPQRIEDIINEKISGHTFKPTSHEDCIICTGLFDELPKFADLVCNSVEKYEFNNYLIGSKPDSDLVATEEELWSKLGAKHPEAMKTEFNRELGKLVGDRFNKMVNFDTPDITIIVDALYDLIKLQIASLFIYGRYRKLSRELPQTRWPCKRCWGKGCDKCDDTGKLYPTSVEEEIAHKVMAATSGKAHFFHGMGREDIGVLMLGTGRPFILEITDPVRRSIDLKHLENEINNYANGKVEVSGLEFTNHRAVRQLKSAKPSKTYNVTVNFEKEVNIGKLKDVIGTFRGRIIEQRTPTRVSHRRADLVRKRTVEEIKLSVLSDNGRLAEISITGESGLYIKELITGDSGRTNPNFTEELGMECIVHELDVAQINDE